MQAYYKQLPNQDPISVAIVVLNYNGLPLLKAYLPTLLRYSNGYPIVVVDNASTDGSVDYIQAHFPTVACIVHDANYGVAKGYNLALRQLKATYYLLLNNDLLVTKHWLKRLLALMEGDPAIACCQPKILALKKPDHFDYAGAAGGFIDGYGYPFCRGRIFNRIEKDNGQYDDTRAVFWASGACLLVRASAFHMLGGFDELFFAHFEEIDWCQRAQLAGWKVYYCGSSTVYHLGGATLPYNSPKKTYLNFRNRLLLLYKHHPNHLMQKIRNVCLDLLAIFWMLMLGKFAHSWAILKAQIDFFKLKKKCMVKPSTRPLPNRYKGSILMDFFIKKKKYFSKLAPDRFT
ncbi:MAG: glycosyltransferase family 2 protein [Candidatus Cardinium sp.]|uniref:glycosyltransferase family 2 protein n=1 Tax=Cardinium endosymbiont of Dermatophagoides farinae TaxID=2597823 RepID=UPI0011840562|nr:glycosyltransferase family 2 protein [Cardinium endosymbiont of Dermatophagoides farinae]TSJ80948.1 glycosyltransferase family 2 protein [Cardinium endosymbiont of Dermatophagoides farinae]UWW96974.1 MAG: glycosyltransferase family 2 protein [Candidatus Cardinium sp.]